MALAQVLASLEAQRLRGGVKASHVGSWREFPDGRRAVWRCPRLLPAREGFDHDHLAAAARAWRPDVRGLVRFIIVGRRCNLQQSAGQTVGQYCSKGQLVSFQGRIHYTQWEDKDGVTRYGTEILADKVDFLSRGNGSADDNNNQDAPEID